MQKMYQHFKIEFSLVLYYINTSPKTANYEFMFSTSVQYILYTVELVNNCEKLLLQESTQY